MAKCAQEVGRLQPLQFESVTFDWDVTDAAAQLQRLPVGKAIFSPTFVTGADVLRHRWYLKLKWADKETKKANKAGLHLAKMRDEGKWSQAEVHVNVILLLPDSRIVGEGNFRRSFSTDEPNDWGWTTFVDLNGIKDLKIRVTLTTDHQIFARSTLNSLASFLNTPKWADVKLICKGGEKLSAHKLILVNSNFFADKLARDPLREKISVKDYTAEVVSNVLKFLYTGQVDVDNQQIVEVSKFAKDTGDQQLDAYCQAKLISNVAAHDQRGKDERN